MNSRICHDAAWATTVSIMEVIGQVLRDDEKRDAFMEILERVKAGIEAYEWQINREQIKLRPCQN